MERTIFRPRHNDGHKGNEYNALIYGKFPYIKNVSVMSIIAKSIIYLLFDHCMYVLHVAIDSIIISINIIKSIM